MSKKRTEKRDLPPVSRLCIAAASALVLLVLAVAILPWHFPYDRLEHLYGIGNDSVYPVGYPGGEFELYGDAIPGSPRIELLIDGEYYTDVEYLSPGKYRVTLGPELFAEPGQMEIILRETFALPISLRSNMIRLYVME